MAYYREPRRPATDPVQAGAEAVAAGYRTVESVFDAFAQSLRRRPGAGYARGAPPPGPGFRAAGPRAGFRAGPRAGGGAGLRADPRAGFAAESVAGSARRGLLSGRGRDPIGTTAPGGFADLTAELFDLLGEILQDVAGGIGGFDWFGLESHTIELVGAAGKPTDAKFWFTNSGTTALGPVTFEATSLIGAAGTEIGADAVSFTPQPDPNAQIQPGITVECKVTVAIPGGTTPPGFYRGVVVARTAPPTGGAPAEAGPDAWALLELEVTPGAP
jgi:hypothetical protein